MNIDRATAAQTLLKHRKPQGGPPVRSSDVVRLLDYCQCALVAASADVQNRDLAIRCRQLADECGQAIRDMLQPNRHIPESDSTH